MRYQNMEKIKIWVANLSDAVSKNLKGSARYLSFLAIVGFAALFFGAPQALAATQVNLGTADSFAILAGSGITNTGPTTITGDVGTFPTLTETGFSSITLIGTNHVGDSVTQGAKTDLVTAYNNAAGQLPVSTVPTELGGTTKIAGVYNSAAGTFGITGTLTLDAQGDPNAVFIFKTGSTLITASASNVNLINGAQACNVFWQVGSSATLGTNSIFNGNILALTSITLNTGATISGRALARNGAVTMDSNVITTSICVVPTARPTLGKGFSPVIINETNVSTLTITLSNPSTSVATLTAPLIDILPAGVTIAPTPNNSTTCGGTALATAGGPSVTLSSGSTIPAAVGIIPGTCTVTVDVTAPLNGSYLNNLTANALQTDHGNNTLPAIATLTVVPLVPPGGPPTLGKGFSPFTIIMGGVSTLTITLSNPNTSVATLTAPFIDTLPAGVKIAPTPNNSTTCGGGTALAIAGGSNVTLPAGSTIPAAVGIIPGTCIVKVNVTAPLGGSFLNTLAVNVLQTSNGNNTLPAIATLTVTFPTLANISGMKFNDSNNNGINDGEQGLQGWVITLRDSSGAIVGTTTTDASGKYNFTGLLPGAYLVFETQQTGWTQTAPKSPGTYVVVLNGVDVTGKNFGNFKIPQPGPGKVTGWGIGSKGSFNIWVYSAFLPSGTMQFTDKINNKVIKATRIDSVMTVITTMPTTARITGMATVNGAGPYAFTVNVVDAANPGAGKDMFTIDVSSPTPYHNSGTLTSGDIQIVK